jgi:hypothetical protein
VIDVRRRAFITLVGGRSVAARGTRDPEALYDPEIWDTPGFTLVLSWLAQKWQKNAASSHLAGTIRTLFSRSTRSMPQRPLWPTLQTDVAHFPTSEKCQQATYAAQRKSLHSIPSSANARSLFGTVSPQHRARRTAPSISPMAAVLGSGGCSIPSNRRQSSPRLGSLGSALAAQSVQLGRS